MTTTPFEVLVVCTGNVCRSPFAAGLLRNALGRVTPGWPQAGTLLVESAGTRALVGEPMPESMQRLAELAGAPDPLHLARQLTPSILEPAGLVLAVSREHRGEIVRMLPRVSRPTFALTEFARLLADLAFTGEFRIQPEREAADSLRLLVAAVASRRGFTPPPADPAVDDIVDPYGRSDAVYEESAQQIAEAVDTVSASLSRMFQP